MNYKMVLVSIVAIFLVGCSALGIGVNKQDAILQFINEDVNEASEYQENSALAFNEILFDPDISEEEAIERIQNEVIPEAEKALDAVESIDVPIEELQEPYDLLNESIHLYVDLLDVFVEWIETYDYDMEEEMENIADDYDRKLNEYHNLIEDLAYEYDIDYERYELDIE